jgi:hypothetical protein
MDLPRNLPLGPQFWQPIFDAAANLTTGNFILADELAERLSVVTGCAERDPRFKKALRAAPVKNVCFRLCEQIAWALLRNAPDSEDRLEGAKLLLRIVAKKQNVAGQ